MAFALGLKILLAAFLILGMWVSQTTSRSLYDLSMKERNEQWMARYGRVYVNDMEKEMRFKTFNDNVEFIESFNNAGPHTHTLGVNQFADMTKEEFNASRNGYKTSSHSKSSKTTSFKKARKFKTGLNLDIQEGITPLNIYDYDEIIDRALNIERTLGFTQVYKLITSF
ncbi:hypothetical protein RJ640_006279 [Escallonia rubra]|uniref:Cathepsin propeptide inhibitor domain-containing protein n=1 Tax=Escallonia rubra TaxID=112253 RepID=A0AA88RJU9_9ASTE|nr:hypothetical protein RJ640_006279 [Escallonia rubra]